MTEIERTLGSLVAADLGTQITFADGGATYTGFLQSAHHDKAYDGRGENKTLVTLKADSWRFVKTYPSSMVCTTQDGDS